MPLDAVNRLATKLDNQRNISVGLSVIQGGDHFYQDKLDKLDSEVGAYLDEALKPAEDADA